MSFTTLKFLGPGQWHGKGSFQLGSESLGHRVTCQMTMEPLQAGFHAHGHLDLLEQETQRDFSINLQPDDFGTFALMVRFDGHSAEGIGKLAAAPGLGMVWTESGSVQASFTLFDIQGGHGLRGIVHAEQHVFAWELALARVGTVATLDKTGKPATPGSKIVSLSSRRRPRGV